MKITCQACQAKYTIADEKVSGKVVKIRCKKCGATIVVNGNDPSVIAAHPTELGGAFDDAAHTHAPERWTVHVAEGDERTMTEPELVAAYQASVVTDDTFCWKEGMADWLPVVEIAALHAACTSPSAASAGGDFPGKSQEGVAELGAGASAPPSPPGASKTPKDRNGAATSHAASPAPPVAARRAGGRAAAADLFGGVAQAGGEDEVMTSAPPAVPVVPAVPFAHGDPQRAVGARADHRSDGSSSRDASGAAPPSMTATTEASGLIDIRQLGAQMRSASEEKKKSRIDDIMNLGGGGAFSPSLAAPVLSAPSLEHYSQPPPGLLGGAVATQIKSNLLLIVAACAGLFFLLAAVGVGVLIFRGSPVADDRERTAASAGAATASATTGSEGTAAAAPTVEAPQASVATAAPAASVARASELAGSAPRPSDPANAAAPAVAPSREATAESTAAHAPVAAPKVFVAAAPKEAPAPAAQAGAEFNLGEARARLASISGGVQTCKRGDTSGSGKVEIVFGPSGAAQSASLMGGSPFDGTPTGKCVEARFRQARVPPFGGSPMPVTKSFTIN
jgi:predicted Zn finger-like uncharacterized protein